MEPVPYKRYPVDSADYKLYEEIGEGCSAIVYRALCIPFNEIVAIKVLDLERCNNDLDGIRREVHTMSLIEHPKVLRALCSFTADHSLWVVMPYMAGGSCLHIMKSSFPEGFEEPVIATLLRETLTAIAYLHAHGHIHRDVKAGNILLDTSGTVKLADFGVSACMFDTGDRHQSRNTFVGTPCWMAPEVMQQVHGYDFRADIWSFGITALELAHGHAPFSKYPPMKVLLMTLQNAPPGLDQERDKKFSKSFKDLVAACLVKDPKKRPSAEKLLKHSFFRSAKNHEYLAHTIVEGLSPLGERFRTIKEKEAELLQNKVLYGDKEHLSQQEYIRGISAWNFNVDDLKNRAALIEDNDAISSQEHASTDASNSAPSYEDGVDDMVSLDGSLTSAIQPLQSFKDVSQAKYSPDQKCNNALLYNQRRDTNIHAPDPAEDSPEGSVVSHKGRFKVTSANLSPKESTSGPFNPVSGNSSAQAAQNVSSSSIIPSLQFMLQQNNVQKDEIVKLIKCVEGYPGNPFESADAAISENYQACPVSTREGGLKTQVIHLQQRIGSLVEELQRQKLKNAQLERHLGSIMVRKE